MLILAPILLIAVVLYIAYPLLKEEKEAAERQRASTEKERLMEQKEDVIANLKDIEMDYRMGKLSDEDYRELKLDFERRAVEAFQEIERLEESRRARKKKS